MHVQSVNVPCWGNLRDFVDLLNTFREIENSQPAQYITFKKKKKKNRVDLGYKPRFVFKIWWWLVSNCRRRIDEMKSTASNTSNRQVRNQTTTPMNRVTHHPAGSTGHLSNNSGGAGASAEISLADQEARQALQESKKAIDHLKSVTGIYLFIIYYNKTQNTHIFKSKSLVFALLKTYTHRNIYIPIVLYYT